MADLLRPARVGASPSLRQSRCRGAGNVTPAVRCLQRRTFPALPAADHRVPLAVGAGRGAGAGGFPAAALPAVGPGLLRGGGGPAPAPAPVLSDVPGVVETPAPAPYTGGSRTGKKRPRPAGA